MRGILVIWDHDLRDAAQAQADYTDLRDLNITNKRVDAGRSCSV